MVQTLGSFLVVPFIMDIIIILLVQYLAMDHDLYLFLGLGVYDFSNIFHRVCLVRHHECRLGFSLLFECHYLGQ